MATMSTQIMQVPSVVTTGLVVVSVIFPILSLLSIYFRCKARKTARQRFQADDWLIGATWIFTLALSINAWVFGGMIGIDTYKINPLKAVPYSLMCLLVSSAILQVSLALVKISVLFFYKRIFSTPKFRMAAWIGIAVIAAWGIVFFFLVIFEGNPVSASWTGVGTFNFDPVKFGVAQVGTSIALDIVVLAYPLPVLFGLHMRTRRKVAIGFIFWLGAFCCIAAIVRLVLLDATLAKVAANENAVSTQSKQYIFMMLEPNCSIIAACLPCYGPLFAGGRAQESLVRSVSSMFSLRSRGSKGSHGSGGRTQSKGVTAHRTQSSSIPSDSQAELAQASQDWSKQHAGQNIVNVERLSHGTDEEEGKQTQGIYMTKHYDVMRK